MKKITGIVHTATRRTIYLRAIKGEECIVAGSLTPVVWADEFEPYEEDTNVYETLVLEVPVKLAKRLASMGDENQAYSDGYEAYKKTAKYLKNAEII